MWWPVFLIVVFTLLSGVGDTYGFSHASALWQDGRIVWRELIKSALGFQFGFAMYWVAVRYLKQVGVTATEVQTLLWFAVTIVGIALLSGKFSQWQRLDQIIGLITLAGIGWLLVRTGG